MGDNSEELSGRLAEHPDEVDTITGPDRPILRLALAMRGGVSLAVWIGGAVAELDVLRRAVYAAGSPEGPSGGGPRDLLAADASWPDPQPASADFARAEELREQRRRIYRYLLDLADIEEVQIDVLAGASAGGLNAVLYGTALANGRRIDDMRDVWADLAEFQSLLRPTARRHNRFVPSLLRGDEYFYLALRERLDKLVQQESDLGRERPGLSTQYLTVALSATVLPQLDRAGVREQRERGADSGRASFSLAHRPTMGHPRYTLSDIPAGVPDDSEPAQAPPEGEASKQRARWRAFLVDRLALAGRATSSFPGGFEPARVHADELNPEPIAYYQRADQADPAAEDVMTRYRRSPLLPMPNMSAVFSAARPVRPPESSQYPFHVVDGGVLDNIAVGRALSAIANSPSEVHTRRWLVYLDPDPAKPPVPRFGSIRPAAFTIPRLMLRLAGMRAASSTVRDDLEAIQAHNERAQARRATTDAFTRQLTARAEEVAAAAPPTGAQRSSTLRALTWSLADAASSTPPAEDAHPSMWAYHRLRAATDLPRITNLLVRPQRVISGQIVRKKAFDPWSEESVGEVMVQLRDLVKEWYSSPDPDGLHLDLTAVMDMADFLIAWIRALERWEYTRAPDCIERGKDHHPGVRKRLKRVLYRVLFVATALRDLADQEMLESSTSTSSSTTAATALALRVPQALNRVRERQRTFRLPRALDPMFNPGRDAGAPTLTKADSDALFYDGVAEYLAGDPTAPDALLDLPANLYLWGRLTELFEAVRDQSPILHADCRHDVHRPWRESPFHLLTRFPELAGPAGEHGQERVNPALALLGPVYAGAGGLPNSTQMVAFDTFTADRLSPLYSEMTRLRRAVGADWARSMLRGRMPDASRSWLDSRTKLAGNQLANFAGFLDKRWRHNDWMWGRADTAANIVSLILRQVSLAHVNGGKPDAVAAVTELARLSRPADSATVPDAGIPQPPGGWTRASLERLGQDVTTRLQHIVVGELLGPVTGGGRRLRRGRPTLADITTGQETPVVLAARRRSGLIVHAGLLAAQAVLPSPVGFITRLVRLTAQVLRPVFVLLLLCAMPARAALMLGLVAAAAAASDVGGDGSALARAIVLAAVGVAGCAMLGLRASAAGRRLVDAEAAAAALRDRLEERETISDVGELSDVAEQEQRRAREDSADLADDAVKVVKRVRTRRLGLAGAVPFLFALVALGAVLSWSSVAAWLSQGNEASFAGLVFGELSVFALARGFGDHPLRGRTGLRRGTRPWVIWSLAVVAFVAAVVVGRWPHLVEAINRQRDGDPLTPDSDVGLTILAGAALVCALVVVASFDWMRWRWLPVACALGLATYVALFGLVLWASVPITLAVAVIVAGVAYGIAFPYFITVWCESRFPHRRGPDEPESTPETVRFGDPRRNRSS